MLDQPPFTFRVTDLKQYAYCPRILYYHMVLPAVRPVTFKLEAGIDAHTGAQRRERRRSLRTYGLQRGERHFNVPLFSTTLSLSGEVDLLIETEKELIPVDYKNARLRGRRPGENFRLQLMAYGRLLEEEWPGERAVRRGFLYFIPERKAATVSFTPALRSRLDDALCQMKAITHEQRMPPPTKRRRRCVDCEFRRFCNDVL